MTGGETTLTAYKALVADNPYTGTTEQVVTTSLAIADASAQLDKATFLLFRDETGINEKVFSKLKKIGETLQEFNATQRRELVKGLPSTYSSIHVLCSLKPDELVTAVKSKNVTRTTSVKGAREYVTQIRHPERVATDGEKGRWGSKHEQVWNILRPAEVAIGDDAIQSLEEELRRVCGEYGLILRKNSTEGLRTLRQEERRTIANYWRNVLEKGLTAKWFRELSDEVKTKFNLKTIDEVRDTPLRNFTGFLIHADGGREKFWQKHGRAYVAKVSFLMESSEDAGQRYNLKRRLEQVLGDRNELATWYNLLVKDSGIIYLMNRSD